MTKEVVTKSISVIMPSLGQAGEGTQGPAPLVGGSGSKKPRAGCDDVGAAQARDWAVGLVGEGQIGKLVGGEGGGSLQGCG